jgi:hypothetical protein
MLDYIHTHHSYYELFYVMIYTYKETNLRISRFFSDISWIKWVYMNRTNYCNFYADSQKRQMMYKMSRALSKDFQKENY